MNTPKLLPLPERLCDAARNLRTSSIPLADFIPLLQQAADAIESAATEPLLQRIAELEQRNRDLYEDVQRFRKHAMNEKAARMELERQLEEARNQALEEAANGADALAKKWWARHCETNRHMETTREAHEDFCQLGRAIRALKGAKE